MSADYRLATFGWNATDIAEDVLDSFAWLVDNGADFGIDADRAACFGESAGGWACAFLAHHSSAPWADNARFSGRRIKGMLGAYPPYDFRAFLEPEFQKLKMVTDALKYIVPVLASPHNTSLGLTLRETIETRVDPFNIVTYVTSESPPTLTFHGDSDKIVPHNCSVRMHAQLKELGVPQLLITVPSGGHGEDIGVNSFPQQMQVFGLERLLAVVLKV